MTTVVTIDVAAAGGIEPGRLERCLGLEVEPTGRGRYLVRGGTEPHWVDLHSRLVPRCDCGDHLWREQICKHILAAMLREGDERVIREVGGAGARPPRARRLARAAEAPPPQARPRVRRGGGLV
jgi:hypothetical protein